MPFPGFRKLSITLTIVVIVAHPSCGFTLHRKTTAEAIPGPTTDLASQESLHVKSIKRPNDINEGKDADTNKTTKNKFRFTSELKFIESTEDPTLDNMNETQTTVDITVAEIATTQDVTTKQKDQSELTGSYPVSETTTEGIKTTARANTTFSKRTATSKNLSVENITENLHKTELINNSDVSTTVKVEPTETASSSTFKSKNEGEVNGTSEVISNIDIPTVNDQIAIDSEGTENLLTQKKTVTNATTLNIIESENTKTEIETSINTSTTPIASSKINEKPKITPSEAPTVLSSEAGFTKTDLNHESSESSVDKSKRASTLVDIQVAKDSSIVTTEPTWKKYITIERKRVGSSEETPSSIEKEQDLAKAESIQTTLPIPSLEMLREDLLSSAKHLATEGETQTRDVTSETESMPTSESFESTQSETLGTVASKRAGFLDLSKRTSAHYEQTSTDMTTDYRTMYEIEATDIETQEIKKINGYESQSQLAEDAIKEELLKEEIISNHEENSKRNDDGKDAGKPLADNVKSADSNTSQAVIEDTLSVQPINQDRRTTLYTVGPNYKPMKRIEVQPAKPFVRDPDDNSWRNESISSLGIVFKPKNSSSKSYKEVLKTKTETELNNLQDKDNKDTPELRERLEKITEVRKSKKKRIDKFGEVVYTDYEEGSAEGTSTPKATEAHSSEMPSTVPSKISETEVTLLSTMPENQRYWKNKLETISKEEMFKDLGLDTLTTEKPKKPYNIAEYYDTTDEYDADYANLPKIDLKKFTVPFKPTFPSLISPPMPPTTRIMPPRFPERKPTVQYFPPTTKPQKVNVNDYDVDFERRVQLYTLKETPKTISPFVDISSVPVATDRPEIRPTVKPSDFTMFTPQSPEGMSKHVYMTDEPRVTEAQNFVINDGNFNRGTYVIKHYRDFLNDAAKEEDDERSPEFIPYTETPPRGVTLDELAISTEKGKTSEADYEYVSQFRKQVLSRFVDNFNQNSDRFKVDFPVLFNTSVVHRSNDDEGRVLASSSTFMKRLYGNEPTATKPPDSSLMNRGCEPNCDNITVELSPAYELHYYVPEQEEKEEADQRPITLPYRYKL